MYNFINLVLRVNSKSKKLDSNKIILINNNDPADYSSNIIFQ